MFNHINKHLTLNEMQIKTWPIVSYKRMHRYIKGIKYVSVAWPNEYLLRCWNILYLCIIYQRPIYARHGTTTRSRNIMLTTV